MLFLARRSCSCSFSTSGVTGRSAWAAASHSGLHIQSQDRHQDQDQVTLLLVHPTPHKPRRQPRPRLPVPVLQVSGPVPPVLLDRKYCTFLGLPQAWAWTWALALKSLTKRLVESWAWTRRSRLARQEAFSLVRRASVPVLGAVCVADHLGMQMQIPIPMPVQVARVDSELLMLT